jgi:hypothetical protein
MGGYIAAEGVGRKESLKNAKTGGEASGFANFAGFSGC